MALTAAGLAAALTSEQGASQDAAIQDAANLDLATAIINYLKANTVVSVNVAVDPGSHIGTGTGTIS
jgi:hypothetical protein